jgi:hypothetical protein
MGKMPMPHKPSLMVAIALPRFAKEDDTHDEDSLRREPVPDHRLARDDHGDDELFNAPHHEELLSRIFHALRSRDETSTRAVLTLARCLEKMAHARNESELRRWCARCSEISDSIPPSDEEEETDG